MAKKKSSRGEHGSMAPTTKGTDLASAVVQALEDERYDWRTVGGLAKALGASESEIMSILNSSPNDIVRTQDADGQTLFTTRSHYQKTHGLGDKILPALADRITA